MALTDTAQLLELQTLRKTLTRTNQLLEALLAGQGIEPPEPPKGGWRGRKR